MIEEIHAPPSFDGSQGLLAVLVGGESSPGLSFHTAPHLPQQVATMRHPAGHAVAPHFHPASARVTYGTPEVLIVKSGAVRADLYTSDRKPAASRELRAGDILVLVAGGHGFAFLEDSEVIEVKAGPYRGEHDKVRFTPDFGHHTGCRCEVCRGAVPSSGK